MEAGDMKDTRDALRTYLMVTSGTASDDMKLAKTGEGSC